MLEMAGGLQEPKEWHGAQQGVAGGTTAQVSVLPHPAGDREPPTLSLEQESQPCLHTHHSPSLLSAV